ncbi:MAG: DUF488 domain-containing protein [Hyphomicrobiales bacterium]|nr:DUF488 domain-containing protein [Hyphomicrobiales bacterium]
MQAPAIPITGDSDILTIGHSNWPLDQFLSLLKGKGITAIVDVRSVPFSRRFPWFSSRTLSERLQAKGMSYWLMGDSLGGRPLDPTLYSGNVADYEAMAATAEFQGGIDRLMASIAQERLCLMCAEREPLDCHRCLLVSRALAARGCGVGHILGDGSIEPHAATEQRLLSELRPLDDLFTDRESRLADAYRRRAAVVASRLSDRVRPGRNPRARGSRAFMAS